MCQSPTLSTTCTFSAALDVYPLCAQRLQGCCADLWLDSIESFFNLVPNLPRMMHRPRLLARMALPPTHQNFPHPALLHAICSCASLWCAPAVYSSSTMCTDFNPFITSQPGYAGKFAKSVPTAGNLSFSATQANFAKEAIQEGLTTGHKLLDVVRAIVGRPLLFMNRTGRRKMEMQS